MIMTEADLSSQQKISVIVTKLFDETEFTDGTTRLDITSVEEIYEYMEKLVIPLIFDEQLKAVATNPYMTDIAYLESLANETNHYLHNFNYFVGMRITYKRARKIGNADGKSSKVLPEQHPGQIFSP